MQLIEIVFGDGSEDADASSTLSASLPSSPARFFSRISSASDIELRRGASNSAPPADSSADDLESPAGIVKTADACSACCFSDVMAAWALMPPAPIMQMLNAATADAVCHFNVCMTLPLSRWRSQPDSDEDRSRTLSVSRYFLRDKIIAQRHGCASSKKLG